MDNKDLIERCPNCGGFNLMAVYDTSNGKSFAKGAGFGIIGLAISLVKSGKKRAQWQCQSCGTIFPMKK